MKFNYDIIPFHYTIKSYDGGKRIFSIDSKEDSRADSREDASESFKSQSSKEVTINISNSKEAK